MNTAVHFSSARQDWRTPPDLFAQLDAEFRFTLDAAASDENALCSRYFTEADDGLSKPWGWERVYVNPPYADSAKWIEKAATEAKRGALVVMLLPARTDTRAFHQHIYGKAEVRFLPGRLRFVGTRHAAPFPSMVVVFRPV